MPVDYGRDKVRIRVECSFYVYTGSGMMGMSGEQRFAWDGCVKK